MVDVELLGRGTEPTGLAANLHLFLDWVELSLGVKPILYTSPTFWDRHFGTDEFCEYPLWVAEYGVAEPRLPQGFTTWHLWQWRGDATVAGVEKGADLSHVNRAGVDLDRLLIPGLAAAKP